MDPRLKKPARILDFCNRARLKFSWYLRAKKSVDSNELSSKGRLRSSRWEQLNELGPVHGHAPYKLSYIPKAAQMQLTCR